MEGSEMRRGVLLAVFAGVLLWSCGGGITVDEGAPAGGDTSYFININSFSVNPSTVGLGESFTVSAGFSFNSLNGVVLWTIRVEDQSGVVSTLIQFFCGPSYYNCTNDFTISCSWYEDQNGNTRLACTDPLGSTKWRQIPSGTYTLTAEGCVFAGLQEICDSRSALLTLL